MISDQEFYTKCLDLEREELSLVREPVLARDYKKAGKALADTIRKSLDAAAFFSIPYEEPENIYKLPGESDREAIERIGNHIMVSVGVPCDFGRDNPIDWSANPTYNQYKEWTWQLNRHHELKLLAHEYNQNPRPEYAVLAAELFLSWAGQAEAPGEVSRYETKMWRTIECGIRMGASWPYALFTFFRTDAFTDQVLVTWYKSMWEHGMRLYSKRTRGNWLIMEMNGLAYVAIICPWFRESSRWLSTALQSLSEELDRQIYADGFHYELSTGYHDTVLVNYQRIIEMARAFHIPIPDGMEQGLHTACEAAVKLMMPDGRLPDINDGKWLPVKEMLEPKERIFKESPLISWILSDGAKGREPDYQSTALDYSGFLVMRTGWEPSASWALFDGGPFGRGHQHEDKLSVLFYGHGKLLLTEGGNYAYDDSEMRRYVLSARAHNTVQVDGCGQNRRAHYEWRDEDIHKKAGLRYRIGEELDYGEGIYEEGYGADAKIKVRHSRRVFFIKNPELGLHPFLIVSDRLEAAEGKEHSYEALWHVDSKFRELREQEGRISFEEAFICVSQAAGSLNWVYGAKEPEWQGFAAMGTQQGMYRPVACVRTGFEGSRVRLVTVLYFHPAEEQELHIVHVEAGRKPEDDDIRMGLSDGRMLSFLESSLMEGDSRKCEKKF